MFEGERLRLLPSLIGLLMVALVTIVGKLSPGFVTATHIAFGYLLVVLFVAIRYGLWPALITAVVSVGALDFLFTRPIYSFFINSPEDILLVALFAVVAATASSLASRLRAQTIIAGRRAGTATELYRFAGKLAATATPGAVTEALVLQVADMLGCRAALSLGATEHPRSEGLRLALRAGGETVGEMIVTPPDGRVLSKEERRLLDTLGELAGLAIGRLIVTEKLAQLGIEQEADRLRSALLDSIAHDLTAPISSLASTLTSLKGEYQRLDEAARRGLIGEAEQEAERLHRFSANLVDMMRLERGVLQARREPADLGDVVGSALVRAGKFLAPRRVVVEIPGDLPRASVDFVLMEQALFNLLENAGKYTPADATITISAEGNGAKISLRIADDGPGFHPDDNERLFAKFYRAGEAGNGTPGTGLGLAICRGFIEAQGGAITAANRSDGTGALFTIVVPVDRATPANKWAAGRPPE